MTLRLTKNWLAKILCLLLATGIWFLIKGHLGNTEESDGLLSAPRAVPVHDDAYDAR